MKNILVTGGSRGIGLAVVKKLNTAGYICIAPTRDELDITDAISIENYFKSNKIPFDALVNNAGINILGEIETLSSDDIDAMLNTNLVAPIKLIQNVTQNMKKNRFGRIVNISSIWGVASKEQRTLYSATKFGINGITRALAKELGEYNILINSVAPGYVNTELTQKNVSTEEQEKIKAIIPLKRFAEPEEIANIVSFLLSEENTYITGQTLIADGGYLA